jgi:hypothetical protein
MLVRIETFVRLKVRRHQTQLYTLQFGVINDRIKSITTVLALFTGNLIPPDQICRLRPAFFKIDFGAVATRHLNRVAILEPFSARLSAEVARLKRPLWAVDFRAFLQLLVQEAEARQVPDLSYFSPLEGEVSLSRCLFRIGSAHRESLDAAVGKFADVSADAFSDLLLRECYGMIPDQSCATPTEESLMLLLFYRCLFHRTYERFPAAFAPAVAGPRANVAAIAALPARWFAYPRAMVSGPDAARSIGEVFRGDRFLHAAGQFLETGLWVANPLDMTFAVHKAIVAIQKGAFINRLKDSGEPVGELLCFDDLFVLLFGTLLGADDIPDVEYIAWFIGQFAPKDALSAAFDYAKATIEGLAAHCAAFDIAAFVEEHNQDPLGPVTGTIRTEKTSRDE